ncbi:DNA cytosine methyltransferase [Teredinibacter turnerae]|uniref:DNA cytosine methyltransferase n=1 Tax=Teredinibacter turnerae TaxID=2426 RepID=UPI000A9DD6BC|nr:DNA cytosine methyltransferase [Teredinibacter turnerae]
MPEFIPKAIDLFAGCGGLTYGLKKANFDVISAIELDPVAISTYRLNHPNTLLLGEDIRDINPKDWMKSLHLSPGKLDLLAGCPPCQGFSKLRTRNGSKTNRDSRNRLLLNMADLVSAFRPKAVLMENVPELAGKAIFKKFIKQLKSLGYHVNWDIHDVQDFGVPQRRRRLVLVGGAGFDVDFSRKAKLKKTVRMAISDLPKPGSTGDILHDMPEKRSPDMELRIELTPKDGGSRTDLPSDFLLECHKRSDGYKDVYGRMFWDRVSPTITGGCSNPSKGRFLHPEENRNITMREAALLQTFPKSFTVPVGTTKSATAQMIGNALPPEFVRRQGLTIRRALIRAKNTRQ